MKPKQAIDRVLEPYASSPDDPAAKLAELKDTVEALADAQSACVKALERLCAAQDAINDNLGKVSEVLLAIGRAVERLDAHQHVLWLVRAVLAAAVVLVIGLAYAWGLLGGRG